MNKTIKNKIDRIKKFIREDIWVLDIADLSKAKARFVRDMRVIVIAVTTFNEQKIGFQSVALSYFCTMAAIPFVAVSFALTNGFDLSNKLEKILYSLSESDPVLFDTIMNSANNIIKTSQSGLMGILSGIMFVWVIIWMMMRVETVFNNVWKVESPHRSLHKRILMDLVILLISPFLIAMFFSGTIVFSHLLDYIVPNIVGFTAQIKSVFSWLAFLGLSILGFSAMFKYIPAVEVRYKYALKSAVIAGIFFILLQYLYIETQVMVTNLNAVYGTVAAVPLFMLWLRYAWLIILYGAQFSYSFQTLENIEID